VIDVALTEWGAGAASLSTKEKTEKLESFVPLLAALTGVGRTDAAQRVADGLRLEFETVWSRVRGRSTETVSAQRAVNEPVSTGERQLLRAALHNMLGDDIRMRLAEDYFEDPACKRIYSAIKDALGKPEPLDFSQIATHLKGDEELRRLSELSVSDENDDFSSEKLLQILIPMERSYVDRRLRQIQYDINDAQRVADDGRLQSLLQEKLELSRKLRTLK
jgi:hypothetical protein